MNNRVEADNVMEKLENEERTYQGLYENIRISLEKSHRDLVPANETEDYKILVPTGSHVIYIHMPFCDTFCRSCPYSKSVKLDLMNEYCDSVIKEIELVEKYLNKSCVTAPVTVFMGGGTPSIAPLDKIERIMTKVKDTFAKDTEVEMTIEANPSSTTPEKINRWVSMGFNRISLGIQSFNEDTLKYYNRTHDAKWSEELCKYLSSKNLNYNIDLLFGHEGHNTNDFLDDIKKAVALNVPHITINPFHDVVNEIRKYKKQKEMYEAGQELLKSNGYIQYSIIDFHSEKGKPSHYSTQYKQGVLALGAGGAGSSLEYGSYFKFDDVEQYISRISQNKPAFNKCRVYQKTQVNPLSLYGLTINRKKFEELYGVDPYIEGKELFDVLKAMGHIDIDSKEIILKNYFRQCHLSYFCLFGAMMV